MSEEEKSASPVIGVGESQSSLSLFLSLEMLEQPKRTIRDRGKFENIKRLIAGNARTIAFRKEPRQTERGRAVERKIIGFHEIERARMRFTLPPSLHISRSFSPAWNRVSIPEESESNGIDRPERGGRRRSRRPTALFSPVIVSVRLRFMRNLLPTSRRASLGHSRNQSMVVQLIRLGYWRNLFLNASPIGLMHTTKCILARALSINSE